MFTIYMAVAFAADGESLKRAANLPVLAHELREKGVPDGDVKAAVTAGKAAGLPAEDTADVLEETKKGVDENGPIDNFGAFVQERLKEGKRGKDLAEAIRAEHGARGKGKGHGKAGEHGKAGAHGKPDAAGSKGKGSEMKGKGSTKAGDPGGKGKGSTKAGDPGGKGKGSTKAGDPGGKGKGTTRPAPAAGGKGKGSSR